jgi:hypothetical protein
VEVDKWTSREHPEEMSLSVKYLCVCCIGSTGNSVGCIIIITIIIIIITIIIIIIIIIEFLTSQL